jgi:hypothetical protein
VRVAGVRLADGRMVWLDAGDLALVPLSQVKVRLPGGDEPGEVFVSPAELLSPPSHIDGLLIEAHDPRRPEGDCSELPGSEFPALGETVRRAGGEGTVVALDPAERRITIAHGADALTVVMLDDVTGE